MNTIVSIINQVYELQQRIQSMPDAAQFERNFSRLQHTFEEEGFIIRDPLHETYSESRTDYEASIVGDPAAKMTITRVLKPAVYQRNGQDLRLIQKAIVIVEKSK